MSILPILIAPDPRLKRVCEPVAAVDGDIRRLMDDMLETMYDAAGIGLAASQVGVLKRVAVVDVADRDAPRRPIAMANPEIVRFSPERICKDEGCLSLPDQYAPVMRPEKISVAYLDREGAERMLEADGLLATCIQHEVDHLNGILFIDHLSSLKRNMILKKVRKLGKPRQGA